MPRNRHDADGNWGKINVRVAICDDDDLHRKIIVSYIDPYVDQYDIQLVEFESGEQLAQAYDKGVSFDIIFMDIRMKDMDGVQAVSYIRKYDRLVIVIFISSFVQYITEVLRHNVFQFLVKPVKQELFDDEFRRALSFYETLRSEYVIKTRERIIKLEAAEIVYIETCERHLLLHTKQEKYLYNGTLKSEYQKLAPHHFVLVHQAYLVNMAAIKTIEKNEVILTGGQSVPLSKHLRKSLLSKFNMYMGRRCL